MDNLALQCRCGQVSGRAIKVTPAAATRVVCYCRDCQRFANWLDAAEQTLDSWGGTDIFQLPPARLQIHQGHEHIRCLRLSEKGLYRWYAGCCKTPIGNSLKPSVPLIGLISSFVSDSQAELKTGPVCARVNLGGATAQIPSSLISAAPSRGYLLRLLGKMASWKLRGLGRPHPFFAPRGEPISPPQIIES